MVFCRTRTEVDQLTETLNARGYRCASLHGGHNQAQRDRVMNSFRSKGTELLIATDVAARGLDVKHVSHVINFDVPQSGDSYIHRIGRTGRAGREGVAITFAEPREHRQLRQIEAQTRQRIVVKQVPTVADLNARRMAVLQDQLRETIETGELDSVRVVVESLAAEYDIMDVAAAAVRQLVLSSAGGEEDTADIPVPSGPSRSASRGKSSVGSSARPARGRDATTRLFIGGGRKLKIRPGDIVGAIVTHTSVSATQLGAIKILDRHSLVEVPASAVNEIQHALAQKPIKGKKLTVRLDKPPR
jgi:ATP-dependent RNA helicase DeaD